MAVNTNKFKAALIETCGSQIAASRVLKIREARLSYIVRGHAVPTDAELRRFEAVLGAKRVDECFSEARTA